MKVANFHSGRPYTEDRSVFRSAARAIRRFSVACSVIIYGLSLLFVRADVAADSDDDAITWGNTTNDFQAGLIIAPDAPRDRGSATAFVYVKTSESNATRKYVAAPGFKFAKLELKDTDGKLVPAMRNKRLDADLPQRILSEDLPRTRRTPRRDSMLEGMLIIPRGRASEYREFVVNEIFPVRKEGDYTLTVCVAIYKFEPDKKSVVRMDLPCVSARVHLTPRE